MIRGVYTNNPHTLLRFDVAAQPLDAGQLALRWHTFSRVMSQCALLAGPGVIIGSSLFAVVAKPFDRLRRSRVPCGLSRRALTRNVPPVPAATLQVRCGAHDVLNARV